MHERNLVHRDLKSNNIMLSVEGDVKISTLLIESLLRDLQLTKR